MAPKDVESQALLQLEELDFSLGRTQILRSINLSVDRGAIVCLLGRNGAGKSSILKNIIGIYRPTGGRITFNGRDITQSTSRQRVMMGLAYSPEDTRVFPYLTVEENINLGIWITEETRRESHFRLDQALKIFPALERLLHRKGIHLSGGEKKMVSIARALALSPSLLLLDESFEGLAPLIVGHFIEAMREIRNMGISVLLAESNLRNASLVSEEAYIVERGEIIFSGSPAKISEDEELLKIVGR
jgi:branched-chain amino acid transport system ATP-binding protein